MTLKGNLQIALAGRFCSTSFISTLGGLSISSTRILRAILAVTFAEVRLCSSLLLRNHSELRNDFSLHQGSGKNKEVKPFEPTGSSGRSLSRFPLHEAARSISTPPGRDASPSQVTLQQFVRFSPTNRRYSVILLGGERHCESKVSSLRTQHNVPGQGSNPDRSIRGRAH